MKCQREETSVFRYERTKKSYDFLSIELRFSSKNERMLYVPRALIIYRTIASSLGQNNNYEDLFIQFFLFIQFSLALRLNSSIWRWSEKSHTRIRIAMQMKWTLPFAARKRRRARARVRSGPVCSRDNVTWTVTNPALRHPKFRVYVLLFFP